MHTEDVVRCFLPLLKCLIGREEPVFCGMNISEAPAVGNARRLLVIEKEGPYPSSSSLSHRSWILERGQVMETTGDADGGWDGSPTRELPVVKISHSGRLVRFQVSLGAMPEGEWMASVEAEIVEGALRLVGFRVGLPIDQPDRYRATD